jgi:hypothetical protein
MKVDQQINFLNVFVTGLAEVFHVYTTTTLIDSLIHCCRESIAMTDFYCREKSFFLFKTICQCLTK